VSGSATWSRAPVSSPRLAPAARPLSRSGPTWTRCPSRYVPEWCLCRHVRVVRATHDWTNLFDFSLCRIQIRFQNLRRANKRLLLHSTRNYSKRGKLLISWRFICGGACLILSICFLVRDSIFTSNMVAVSFNLCAYKPRMERHRPLQ